MSASQPNTPVFMRQTQPEGILNHPQGPESDVVAREAKAKGDVLFKKKKWRQARAAYLNGAAAHTSDPDVRKAIGLNLAATNLKLGKWDEVLQSTTAVLTMDPGSDKALFRSARALVELKRFEEALDCCDRDMKLDPTNAEIRELRRTTREEAIKRQQQLLLKAYEYNRIRIVPAPYSPMSGLTFQSCILPFFDLPTPSDPLTTVLFCEFQLSYVERFAVDLISGFPSDVPILSVLDTLLPGRASTSKPASRTKNNLTYQRNPLRTDRSPVVIEHPTSWDPRYEFQSSTLSVYVQTDPGPGIWTPCDPVKKLTNKTRLVDLFASARKCRSYLEFHSGMLELLVFRAGSEAEERYRHVAFDHLGDLGDPEFDINDELGMGTNLRNRMFVYGQENKSINDANSTSLAARERILREAYANRLP